MNTHTKIGAGAAAAGCQRSLTMIVGLPLLVDRWRGRLGRPARRQARGSKTDGIPPIGRAGAYERAADAAPGFDAPVRDPRLDPRRRRRDRVRPRHPRRSHYRPDRRRRSPASSAPLPQPRGDTDDGAGTATTTVDHAVGPMQFIPVDLARLRPRRQRRRASPIPTTSTTPPSLPPPTSAPPARRWPPRPTGAEALLAYNHSSAYVSEVLKARFGYRDAMRRTWTRTIGRRPRRRPRHRPHQRIVGTPGPRAARSSRGRRRPPHRQLVPRPGRSRSPSAEPTAAPATTRSTRCPRSRCHPPPLAPEPRTTSAALPSTSIAARAGAPLLPLAEPHAARFGICNLPSEPWHWSVDGR